jgi:hypothetical protein
MTTYALDIITKSCYHEERGSYPGNGVYQKYFFRY